MRLRSFSVSSVTVLLLAVAASMAACGGDDPSSQQRPDGAGGQAAGSPGAAGTPDEAGGSDGTGLGGNGGTGLGGNGGNGGDGGNQAGAGGEGDDEEPLPTFEPYSYDVALFDYYGYQGLYRLTLADTGASEPTGLLAVPAGARSLWQQRDGEGVILTLRDDVHGHLLWQPLAGGAPQQINHNLAEYESVDKWTTVGEDIYYAVGTFMGNTQTHPAALWKASRSGGGYTQVQLTLPEPSQGRSVYDLWPIGDWIYMPGFVTNDSKGYQFHRITQPGDVFEPVALLDYDFNIYQGGDVLTYRGTSKTAGLGIYAANLNQESPGGTRLSPDNTSPGNNLSLHAASQHFFFPTKVSGEGEIGYFADLSREPFKAVKLLESGDPEAILHGTWSTQGRYFYMNESSPGMDITTYVVDTTEEQPEPRLSPKQTELGLVVASPDDRFFLTVRPELWLLKPDDADFALRIDDGIELDGATVMTATFSSDGHHVWFLLSDGRCFIEDTLVRTPSRPVEVTPEVPEGWQVTHASQLPSGAFFLGVSNDDPTLKEAHADQNTYYLPRLPSGKYGSAKLVDVGGIRWLAPLD